MDEYLDTALGVDISKAAATVTSAAVNETTRLADEIMGGRLVPGSPEWEALSGTDAEVEREIATQLLHLRIELAVGIDPIGTVIGLRRWGATWELISQAGGTSRQAAHARWGQQVREVLDRYQTGELGGPVADDELDLDEESI